MASYVESVSVKMDWLKPFQRTGKFPLDRSDLFASYADAVKYAAGNSADPDSRELCGTSYVGQIITVFENDVITVYKIEANRTLAEVGRATLGDGKSIDLDAETNTLSLHGFADATAGQQPRIVNKGTAEQPDLQLEWYTPDNSTVAGLQDSVGALQETVDGVVAEDGTVTKEGLTHKVAALEANKANAADVYTKTEIDGKLTGALHYKGTYETFAALVAAVADGTVVPAQGDVWNITTAGGTDAAGVEIHAGDNVIYNGTGWDVSSGTIDLSGYYDKDEVDAELEKKVDKVEGSRLMTNEEGERLAELTKVGASETNGNIMIDDVDTKVYELPTATAEVLGGVKGSTANDKVAVEADGTMSINKVSSSKIDGVVAEAAKVSHEIKIGDKTFDGSAAVEITSADIPLPASVIHNTDIASEAGVGVVKGSAAQDGVAVAADGTMSVNDVSGSKIKGAVAEAEKVSHVITAGEKSFDGSADVEITVEDLGAAKASDLDNYVLKTDLATADAAGIVKSAAGQDKVAVETDGTMTINDVSGSKVKGAVAEATDAAKLGGIASGDILVDGGNGQVKSAAEADKLAEAKNISVAGDATGSASFDGSADAEITVTLKDVGTAGTYTKVTTDAKGRVVAGEGLAASDIPTLTLEKISDAGALAAKDKVARTDLNDALVAEISDLENKAHEHENKAVIDGITASKVTTWDETAGKIDGKADKATTLAGYGITDAYTKTEIDGKVAGAYHFMGTYATFAELTAAVEAGTITPLAGHVYNITTGGGTDKNGNAIHSGDNVAYIDGEGAGWDCLGGTMDLSAYALKSETNAALDLKADKTTVNGINDRVGELESTVGDETQGLVKTVADHGTRLDTAEGKIADLETAVGDENSGLVKKAEDNRAAIEKLNGEASVEGSVKQIVAASASEINTAIDNITKEGGTIDTKVSAAVSAHNTAEDAHADLFAAKQNKAIQTAVVFEVADFVENDAGNGPAYKATKAVAGLDATKSYSPAISPAIESCAAVVAAVFYPMAEVADGALTLYCTNIPTAAIVVNGTFTEIQ